MSTPLTPEERAAMALPHDRDCITQPPFNYSESKCDCEGRSRPAVAQQIREAEKAAMLFQLQVDHAMLLQLQVDHVYLVQERERVVDRERARVLGLLTEAQQCSDSAVLYRMRAAIESGASEL